MMWRDRELTEDSWVSYAYHHRDSPGGSRAIVRVGDPDGGVYSSQTHIGYILSAPDTNLYRWPTTEELIKHFGEQHDVAGSGTE